MNFKVLCNQVFIPKGIRRKQIVNKLIENCQYKDHFELFRTNLKSEFLKKGFTLKNPFPENYVKNELFTYRNSILKMTEENNNSNTDELTKKSNALDIKLFKKYFSNDLKNICQNKTLFWK